MFLFFSNPPSAQQCTHEIKEPLLIMQNYIQTNFITDVVSTFPWTLVSHDLVFLRFLKLRRLYYYQEIIDDVIYDVFNNYLNN